MRTIHSGTVWFALTSRMTWSGESRSWSCGVSGREQGQVMGASAHVGVEGDPQVGVVVPAFQRHAIVVDDARWAQLERAVEVVDLVEDCEVLAGRSVLVALVVSASKSSKAMAAA